MKKLLLLVTMLTLTMGMGGCAGVIWNSPFYETATIGDAEKMMSDVGAKEVGKYTTIFGCWVLGYETYQGLVSSELRKGGRTYHKVVKDYIFYSQTIGYIVER